MSTRLLTGHVIDVLRTLPPASVEVCCTSPPYHGLRSYGTEPQVWDAAEGCPHEWREEWTPNQNSGAGPVMIGKDRNGGGPLPRKPDGPRGHTTAFCALCGAWRGELGLEPTADLYLAHLVGVFREVRRVLTPWATLWVNLGDSMSGGGRGGHAGFYGENGRGLDSGSHSMMRQKAEVEYPPAPKTDLPAGSLCQIPARFALAMQRDGWLLRSAIVLAKASPMPESVSGWRWERCRVKMASDQSAVREMQERTGTRASTASAYLPHGADIRDGAIRTEWADCPGCPRCEKSDGLVLRRGSWRPTSAYEMLYLFAKGPGYFCDGDAVRNPYNPASLGRYQYEFGKGPAAAIAKSPAVGNGEGHFTSPNPAGANARNVLAWKQSTFRLRSDLTPEQRAYVLQRIAGADCEGPGRNG